MTIIEAFVELKRQGWQLELYELGDDVKGALENAGLLTKPLDEIIKGMQEEQK